MTNHYITTLIIVALGAFIFAENTVYSQTVQQTVKSNRETVQSLGKGDEAKAPNLLYTCWIDYSRRDWNVLKAKLDSSTILDVWRCVRSLAVSWSPDSKYLAVEDPLDRLNTAVLVFRIDSERKKVDLVYQTPYSNSVFDHYQIERWIIDKKGTSIAIRKLASKDMQSGLTQVTGLDERKAITQTIYQYRE